MRIANSSSDYTLIGCNDADGATNAKIVVIGNTYGSGISGGIDIYATSTGSHRFFTTDSATERLRITSTGNVGIGTSTIPSNSLPTSSATSLFVGDIGYGISSSSSADTTLSGIYVGDGLAAARWRINHGSYNLNLQQNNGSGTYNNRGYFANNTGVYSSVSDKRLKKLIEPIQYGLNDVLKFKPVSYLMENQNEDIDKRNLGLIAQDLEYIIPEIVNVPSSSNAVYSLQYTSIIPILIKAIQELNEIVTKNTNTSNMIV